MNVERHYALSSDAVIRHERFGGLVYRYDNRRLYFLHSKPLTDFLLGLDGTASLDESLDAFVAERGLPESSRGVFLKSLEKLRELEVVREL